MIVRVALALILVFALAGCGADGSDVTKARVYFLRDGKVWPVEREVAATADLSDAVTRSLVAGPSDEEKDAGFATAVVDPAPDPQSRMAFGQLVYTLTQPPLRGEAEIDGRRYRRAEFEAQTPAILVESPLAFQEVTTPLRVTGTANTFEATFEYELRDSQGKVVDSNFVTATSGTGTRGTFDFTTKAADGVASLVVFERSAKDGSRIHEVEIPLGTR